MSSVLQMSNGVACSDLTWKTIRICLPYIPYTTFIAISISPMHSTAQHVPLRGVLRDTFVQQIKLIANSHSQRALSESGQLLELPSTAAAVIAQKQKKY